MTKTPSRRLTPQDWLTAGLEVLCARGPEAVKAEPLARYLGTTKGSFYWHFKDVGDFHVQLLAAWEDAAKTTLETALATEFTPVGRLRRMGQVIAETQDAQSANAEAAIRAWARSNAAARASLANVDTQRLDLLQELLTKTGISNPEMARIIYATSIGMEQLGEDTPGDNVRSMGSLVDLVLALR